MYSQPVGTVPVFVQKADEDGEQFHRIPLMLRLSSPSS